MLSKYYIAFLLFSITTTTHATQPPPSPPTSAVQKPPSIITTGPSSLNITHLLAHKDTHKAQPVNHNTYHRGDTTFHSFAFSLQEEWQFALRGHYNLARFAADLSDADCDVYRPPGLLWVQGDQLYANLVTGTPCEPEISTFGLGTVKVGRWYTVSVLVKWGVDGTGDLRLWVDGEKVLEEWGVDTIMDDGRVFWFEMCGLGRCLGQ
ncbi:uncharacterized protein CDV56_101064 [Aspergillus thermomutatus]|uniref:PA14 domain-containing protein n=1 Tax=Aspergillus thermomutatus TaxID=41047 RepID=A0A397GB69_ASPTH|nr:uncharacterized protein CDV56_101064 [Aspergillus thermomutatus]RHZ46213.1 hypothetical protein CDV56_101064 [Aspergillus thermomutatus]